MITSELTKDNRGNFSVLVVKTVLDEDFFRALERGEYKGIGEGIVKEIVKGVYPEMEKRILSDPTFKDRIINEVLIMLANKVADKKLNEEIHVENNQSETQ